MRVGATLLFFGTLLFSSFSDSLAAPKSLLPSILPLTELAALTVPDIGVSGGVVSRRPADIELVAATLGTVPSVGVGLLVIGACTVAIEDVEFDLDGLGIRVKFAGDGKGATPDKDCLDNKGAPGAVGVGIGDA